MLETRDLVGFDSARPFFEPRPSPTSVSALACDLHRAHLARRARQANAARAFAAELEGRTKPAEPIEVRIAPVTAAAIVATPATDAIAIEQPEFPCARPEPIAAERIDPEKAGASIRSQIKVRAIQAAVAKRCTLTVAKGVTRAVTVNDIISARRNGEVVRPRQVAMYLAKVMTLHSLPELGRRFGGRDHTTVLHAVRKIEKRVATDAAFGAEIQSLRREIWLAAVDRAAKGFGPGAPHVAAALALAEPI